MYPILFRIGKINFYSHGFMIAVGFLVATTVLFWLAKREKLSQDKLFDTIIYVFLIGLISSRITYFIIYYNQFNSWLDIFKFWEGGLVSWGGLIGGFIAAAIILIRQKEKVLKWFDLGTIALLTGWAFGRVGCFLNGCCHGVKSASKLTMHGMVPIQLIESAWVLILAIALFLLIKYRLIKNRFDGMIFLLGVGGYCIGRFIIDFWRQEDILFLRLKPGQIASLVVLIGVLATFVIIMIRRSNAKKN